MPNLTIPVTAAQNTALATLATEGGYADATAYVTAIVSEKATNEWAARDQRLISKALVGTVLSAPDQARVKAILNLT